MSTLNWTWWIENRPAKASFSDEQKAFVDAAFREYEVVIVRTIEQTKRRFLSTFHDSIHDVAHRRFFDALLSFQEIEPKPAPSFGAGASPAINDPFLKWLQYHLGRVRGDVAKQVKRRALQLDDPEAAVQDVRRQEIEFEVAVCNDHGWGPIETWRWLLTRGNEANLLRPRLGGDPRAVWSWLVGGQTPAGGGDVQ